MKATFLGVFKGKYLRGKNKVSWCIPYNLSWQIVVGSRFIAQATNSRYIILFMNILYFLKCFEMV